MKIKFPRTYHLPWSEEVHGDDKVLKSTVQFEGHRVVVTEKRDGECTSMYRDGTVHARSIDGTGYPWQSQIKAMWRERCLDLPEGWRVVGENLYARHSIGYSNLKAWIEVFAIFDQDNFVLSWDSMVEWCSLLGLDPVPVLWRGQWNEKKVRSFHETLDLNRQEGYVLRVVNQFHFESWKHFVGKWVRKGHVQTDTHWTKSWVANSLGE